MQHRTLEQLEAGLPEVLRAPRDEGRLEMVVRRPAVGEREVLEQAQLDLVEGLVGDGWISRGSRRTPDGSPNPDMQLTLMSSRAVALVAGDRERWPLAGDQLYVDLDLGAANLPPGTRLRIGEAVVEVTAVPHTGCGKFVSRFGADAMRFVNSPRGRELNLRGVNARVVQAGTVRASDTVFKVARHDLLPASAAANI